MKGDQEGCSLPLRSPAKFLNQAILVLNQIEMALGSLRHPVTPEVVRPLQARTLPKNERFKTGL